MTEETPIIEPPICLNVQQQIARENFHVPLAQWAVGKVNQNPYGYTSNLMSYDFNREMYAPGDHPDYPEGVIGIRVDDSFFVVAQIPWEFKDLRLHQIVCTLWPRIAANNKVKLSYDVGPAATVTVFSEIQRVVEKMEHLEHSFKYLKESMKGLFEIARKEASPKETTRVRRPLGNLFTLEEGEDES